MARAVRVFDGGDGKAELRELSGAVRRSETVTLGYPVEPVADGFLACFVRIDGFQFETGTAIFRPCQRICTSMSCSQASSMAMRRTSTTSPFRSGDMAFAATHLARNGNVILPSR